nr:hypothetical protein [Nitrospinaceae bacterium]NIR55625.1 hypothetical protein [Nitrospinaceae bacterium]NIS86059.1 hypothetical protein [Nitrospinaceae bacterium]NIT82902.1 hypothetical protein [Nitrospinaceae bacterium]NIU45107.1 hypothetical protein [Nitrospinaceae bacterium]
MISVAYWIAVTALVVMLILLFLAFRRLARLKKDRREIDGGRCLIRDLYKLEPAWAGRTQ